ncbi:MAG: rRNA maturation RNase YbeY [Crocinitomicaceae bacterium]|nr:rRNA maturation RNase YbeY [Crocinitomicaceae bacterium]
MIDFTWSKGFRFEINSTQVDLWIEDVVAQEGKTLGDAAVVFCSDEELLEMNKQHLNHDFYTDIITFDYTKDNVVSGDLFISVDRVKENAEDRSLEFNIELNRVVVHGFLHLCAYGDKGEDEKTMMRNKEDFYLNKLKGFT